MPALRPAVRHPGPILQQLQHHIGRRPLVIFNADFEQLSRTLHRLV
ncbi:hypothetical protein ACWPOF_004489 [Salmonella enterica]